MRRVRWTINLLVAVCAVAQQQLPLTFEAASIKPSGEAAGSSGWDTHPGSIVIRGQTLKGLILIAYSLKDNQVSGGPKWLDADRFDINARAAGDAGDPQLLSMLQTLLADRFHLATHHEEKVSSSWVMVVSKTGLKIQPAEGTTDSQSNAGKGKIVARGITISRLVETLSRLVRSPISDLTGVQGVYNIDLQWSTEGDATDTLSALSAALQDQLGIRLELRKVPVSETVVDTAEKPTQN